MLAVEFGVVFAVASLAAIAPIEDLWAWGTTLALVGATATVLYCRWGLVTPGVVAVAGVALIAMEARYDRWLSLASVALGSPTLLFAGGGEYAVRRFARKLPATLSSRTERALLAGTVAGAGYLALVVGLLPPYASLGIPLRGVGLGTFFDPTESLTGRLGAMVYLATGPIVVVGVPTVLFVRDRLVAPLLVVAVEVGAFLTNPGAGDTIGPPSSLLWIYELPAALALAVVERALRSAYRRVT